MGKIIVSTMTDLFHDEKESPADIISFVKSYRPRKWIFGEKVEMTFDITNSENVDLWGNEQIAKCLEFMTKKSKESHCVVDYDMFFKSYGRNRFWVIMQWDKRGRHRFFSGYDKDKPVYSEDKREAFIMMNEENAQQTLNTIRVSFGDRVWCQQVFLTIRNRLLSLNFMIVCAKKDTEKPLYYNAEVDGKIRTSKWSNDAMLLTYKDALREFDRLHVNHSKNWAFAILPRFKDNVNCKDIVDYMNKNGTDRKVVTAFKLKGESDEDK